MNKKVVIIICVSALLLISSVLGFIIYNNNKIISTIIMDINPSIEIGLNKEGIVKKLIPLNSDAKDVITSDLVGKSMEDTITMISNNIIEKGYIEDNNVTILLYSYGNINNREVETIVRNYYDGKNVQADIITIHKVTKEDIDFAKKNNISVAKSAYINKVIDENKNVSANDLIEKDIKELKETKDTGRYCDKGYTLEGDFCLKEIRRVSATTGYVCENGYYEYNGKCYEEKASIETDNLVCRDDFVFEDNVCKRHFEREAIPSKFNCPKGEAKTMLEAGLSSANDGNANDITCVDMSNATHPVSPCEAHDGTEYTVVGGVCYWHRAPVIASGCPGKVKVNGECWDNATGIYICPGYRDGKRYKSKDEYCEHSIKYLEPTVTEYKCEEGFVLNGKVCERNETEDAFHEKVCPDNYKMVNNDRCINEGNVKDKINGYVCNEENSKLKDKICIIYEIKEARR